MDTHTIYILPLSIIQKHTQRSHFPASRAKYVDFTELKVLNRAACMQSSKESPQNPIIWYCQLLNCKKSWLIFMQSAELINSDLIFAKQISTRQLFSFLQCSALMDNLVRTALAIMTLIDQSWYMCLFPPFSHRIYYPYYDESFWRLFCCFVLSPPPRLFQKGTELGKTKIFNQ